MHVDPHACSAHVARGRSAQVKKIPRAEADRICCRLHDVEPAMPREVRAIPRNNQNAVTGQSKRTTQTHL